MHAARLVESFKSDFPARFSAVGSNRLAQAGAFIIEDYRNISVMGISEVFSKLGHIRQAFKKVKKYLREARPSLVVLVDFPGFNLRIAAFAKKLGIPVIYFIPPQIWAWRQGRVEKIKAYVDKVISILPFEQKFYESHGVDVAYVGHPFVNTVKPKYGKEEFFRQLDMEIDDDRPIVTIMPGSRGNEVAKHLPLMLKAVDIIEKAIPDVIVLLPLAESIDPAVLGPFQDRLHNVRVLHDSAYDALSYCHTAIVSSGSVTLEAAILRTPTIVIYEISHLSYLIAKMVVNVKYISLPNLIAQKEVFPEFIQNLDPEKIAQKAVYMVQNGKKEIEKDLNTVVEILGKYDSYELAADIIEGFLERKNGPIPETA